MSYTPVPDDETPAQRRESVRIALGLAHVPVIEFPESVLGEHRFFHLVDLSEGGLSFESPESLESLIFGEEIKGCHLEFSAVDRIPLSVTPRHVVPCTLLDEKLGFRYGCQVSGLDPEAERQIRRTLIAREQRQLRMRSKFT